MQLLLFDWILALKTLRHDYFEKSRRNLIRILLLAYCAAGRGNVGPLSYARPSFLFSTRVVTLIFSVRRFDLTRARAKSFRRLKRQIILLFLESLQFGSVFQKPPAIKIHVINTHLIISISIKIKNT